LLLITWHTLVAKTRVNHSQTGLLEVGSLKRGALGHWPLTPARTPRARPPRSPPHGPGRRGSLPSTGPRAMWWPASNCRPDPLPVHHVLMPAAPANQQRRRRTRAAPPPAGYWPSPLAPLAPPLSHAATRWATTPVTPSTRHARL
jgi:hypothetical protein